MEDHLIIALCQMAGIRTLSFTRIPNEYCGPKGCEICARHPWWLVDVDCVGALKIGWRKRVIVINWEKTGCALLPDDVTEDDTDKGVYYVHAWGYAKAIVYLYSVVNRISNKKYQAQLATETK